MRKRDWGYAPEYVEGMWRMLQQDEPDDILLATGEHKSIKDFVDECIKHLPDNVHISYDMGGTLERPRYQWKKDDENRDILWDMADWKEVIGIDPRYYRPAEVELLLGDPSKAKEKLGWEAKTKFTDLVKIMMNHELNTN